MPNPYNLLSTLLPSVLWYTVLDLKNVFFCLKLSPESQPMFAFEWKDLETGLSGQLTWTRLLQGFKNSPTLLDKALHWDLVGFCVNHPDLVFLQYVDDLLLAAKTEQDCLKGTKTLLKRLGELGYRASAKKAQVCKRQGAYLGHLSEDGQRWLTEGCKHCSPDPTSKRCQGGARIPRQRRLLQTMDTWIHRNGGTPILPHKGKYPFHLGRGTNNNGRLTKSSEPCCPPQPSVSQT